MRAHRYPGQSRFGFQEDPGLRSVLRLRYPNVELLIDQETMLGNRRLYASPFQPWFHDWVYNFSPGECGQLQAQEKWGRISDDTAILVTYGPVYGIVDTTSHGEHVGCRALKARIERLPSLRLHIGGHIHESYGSKKVGDTLYVNASACDARYRTRHTPIVVNFEGSVASVVTAI